MLLKLIPAQSEPTIHFSFSFADLPTNLTAPSAWTAQLSHILVEDLEVPTTSHSLDKAAGITSLLEEVAFDVERGQVRCRFVDGAVEEWAFFRFLDHAVAGGSAGDKQGELEGRKLMIALENIIRNVKESTLEDELFVRELDHVERQRSKTFNGKSSPFKNPKHKKQRSLFMQIVSSIGSMVNITNSSQTLPTHRSPSTTSLHQALQHPSSPGPPLPGTSPRARALRRAARSALVDAYRRFVLSELTHRLPSFSYRDSSGRYTGVHGGGFCVWILHSMRRRAQERLDQLLEEAELRMKERAVEMGVDPFPIQFRKSREESWASGMTIASDRDGEIQVSMDASHRQLEATTMAVPLSFSDDEDDQEMDRDSATVAETDTTDGSSVHTPSSTSHHFATYIGRPPPTIASSESSHSLHSSDGLSDKKASDEFDAHGMLPPRPSAPLPPSPTSPSIPAFSSPPPSPSSTQPAQPQTPTPPPQPSPSHSQYASIRAKNNRISQHLPPTSLFEYTQLVELRERLYHLTVFAESQTRIAAEEVRNRHEVLAVRSRRRAWSCMRLVRESSLSLASAQADKVGLPRGRTRPLGIPYLQPENDNELLPMHSLPMSLTQYGTYGLAMPFRSSPLARYSWTADDWERERERRRRAFGEGWAAGTPPSVAEFPTYRSFREREGEDGRAVLLDSEDEFEYDEEEQEQYGSDDVAVGFDDAAGEDEGEVSSAGFEFNVDGTEFAAHGRRRREPSNSSSNSPSSANASSLYDEYRVPSSRTRRRRNHYRRRVSDPHSDSDSEDSSSPPTTPDGSTEYNHDHEHHLRTPSGRLFPVSEELESEGEEAVDMEFRIALEAGVPVDAGDVSPHPHSHSHSGGSIGKGRKGLVVSAVALRNAPHVSPSSSYSSSASVALAARGVSGPSVVGARSGSVSGKDAMVVRGRRSTSGSGSAKRTRTFMGCDEVGVEGDEDEDEEDDEDDRYYHQQNIRTRDQAEEDARRRRMGFDVVDLEEHDFEDPHALDAEFGLGGFDFHAQTRPSHHGMLFDSDEEESLDGHGRPGERDDDDEEEEETQGRVSDEFASLEMRMPVERPKLMPRVRTGGLVVKNPNPTQEESVTSQTVSPSSSGAPSSSSSHRSSPPPSPTSPSTPPSPLPSGLPANAYQNPSNTPLYTVDLKSPIKTGFDGSAPAAGDSAEFTLSMDLPRRSSVPSLSSSGPASSLKQNSYSSSASKASSLREGLLGGSGKRRSRHLLPSSTHQARPTISSIFEPMLSTPC